MKKRMVCMFLFSLCVLGTAWAQTTVQRSLYVSEHGDDNNDGRSEETPYKTLEKAVEMANNGAIKTITVIGTINYSKSWIVISNRSNTDEILITGKPGANNAEKAVMQGISVDGRFSFTHIALQSITGGGTITLGTEVVVSNRFGSGVRARRLIMTDNAVIRDCGGERHMNGIDIIRGSGVYLEGGSLTMSGNAQITGCNGGGVNSSSGADSVTMSGNAKISGNESRGVSLFGGRLTMSENAEISGNTGGGVNGGSVSISGNAKIINNTAFSGGGIELSLPGTGRITISGNAVISGNTATGNGGGIYSNNGQVTISGNAVISNNTAEKNGGGIYSWDGINQEGGEISGNKAEYGAGVYINVDKSFYNRVGIFTHKGGTITGNTAKYVGGGVYVSSGATYTAGGGKVTGNTAGDGGDDVFRQ